MDTGFEDVDRENGAATDHMTCSYKHSLSILILPPILFHFVRFSYCLLSIYSRKMVLATIAHKCHVNYPSHLKFSTKYMDSRRDCKNPVHCIMANGILSDHQQGQLIKTPDIIDPMMGREMVPETSVILKNWHGWQSDRISLTSAAAKAPDRILFHKLKHLA
jgi:hypothetical protein